MLQTPARPLPRAAVRGRAAFAAILSGLLPGTGQMYAGSWSRGVALLLAPLVGLALAGAALLLVPEAAGLAVRHLALVALLLVGGLFAYHVAVVADAFGALPRRPLDTAVLVVTALVLGLGYFGIYREVRALGGVVSAVFERTSGRTVAPGRATGGASAPAWSGTERLNILLLGVDTRSDAQTQNTDTIIVLSIDPTTRAAAMLSIPRDTLVAIPSVGEDKVNAAYVYGGGGTRGADLARRTVEDFLGVGIHSYAVIDFKAFRETIDSAGGVTVDVRRPLRDEAYPTSDSGVQRIAFDAGPQLMDGERALQYARSRHESNDFGRARRQQQVILALRQRFGQLGVFRLPGIAERVGPLVRTDFDPGGVLPLARLVLGIDVSRIRSEVLLPCDADVPHCELTEQSSPKGYYLIPDKAKVRQLVDSLFGGATGASR